MSEEVATLKDTLNPEVTADTKPTEAAKPAEPKPEPEVTLKVEDKEAADIGRILLDSGVTKDKLNEILDAPKALNSIRYLIQNNPQEFLNMLERTDPKAANTFLEKMADTYVDRYDDKESKSDKKSDDSSPELMREVRALREKTTRLESEQARRDQAAALAATSQRYEARVDDLFGQIPKDTPLTKGEQRALRALLNTELSKDQSVVQRVSNGNFVDVPRTFKAVIDDYFADKKAAAEAAKSQREGSSSRAFNEFPSGPNLMIPPPGTDESWEATEEGFAKALTAAPR